MKRRMVLHLGLWKTGTTTMQVFLRRNDAALAAVGICYPRVLPDDPDHPFYRSKPTPSWIAKEINHQALGSEIAKRSGGPTKISEASLWSIAFERIDRSRAHTTIISYEDFSARPFNYDFGPIAAPLSQFDVVGLVYLRQPEDWAISLYAHLVRGGHRKLSFAAFLDTVRERLTYSVLLDTITAHFPIKNLIVGNFEEAISTNLMDDFFAKVSLEKYVPPSTSKSLTVNRSLPAWAVMFLTWCGQTKMSDGAFMEVSRALSHGFARKTPPGLRPGLDVASPFERSQIREIAHADADRLAARYGITLGAPSATRKVYRAFDETDFRAVRSSVAPLLSQATRDALGEL